MELFEELPLTTSLDLRNYLLLISHFEGIFLIIGQQD